MENLSVDGRIILILILVYKKVDFVEDKVQSEDFFIFTLVYLIAPLSTAYIIQTC